ncbi:MAG: hypothetical protein BGO01_14415 [Armatimonadetes bacterium 55-13]|nr:hypothetical protein [Armatimonadota bacterium]OJU64909.1 MAG: hypothetical protein BGO01_14415 [Armatimonadetes bacterium 55-13]
MKTTLLIALATVCLVAVGCGSAPNDDPKASIAGTNKFRHEMPGGAPAPTSNATPAQPAGK